MQKCNVIVVEDEAIIADYIALCVEEIGHSIIEICDEAEYALDSIEIEKPDLVLLDIRINGKKDGVDIAHELNKRGIPFIFISSNADDKTLDRVKLTNPLGFVFKPFSREQFKLSFELAMSNYKFHQMNHTSVYKVEKIPSDYHLSPTELELLRMLCDGKTTKEIAMERNKSYETVSKQRKSIIEKMAVSNSNHAVAIAQQNGWFI